MDFTAKAVLTLDIVDFSLRSGPEQMEAVDAFIQMLDKAIPKDHNDENGRVWSPAGDGGAVTFWNSIVVALDTAVSMGKLIQQYNSGEFSGANNYKFAKPTKPFALRIGLHHGPVAKKIDFDGRENIWGDGINISARVLSLAKPGQIVASEDYFGFLNRSASLSELSELKIERIGKWWAKHHTPIVLYNIYSEKHGVGIPHSDVEEWFGPFHYPLEQAITMYEAMARDEVDQGKAFRAAVLAKRLLDLNPQHGSAKEIIESISEKRGRFHRGMGKPSLHDDFFSPLSPEALIHFFESARFEVFKKGQIIVKEGQKADSMMMVVSGEIYPSIGGKRILGRDKGSSDEKSSSDEGEEIEVVLREGDVIGEMGLFNPGETRTATLKTNKQTITLTVNYDHLKPVEGASNSAENVKRKEIQDQIWEYYANRTTVNQINRHPLFQKLSGKDRYNLFDNLCFLPPHYQEAIDLSVEAIWNSWIIVVAGSVTVYSKQEKSKIYGPNSLLGSLRMMAEESPYKKIEVSPNTHLISFSWEEISNLLRRSKGFSQDCLHQAWEEKIYFELFY